MRPTIAQLEAFLAVARTLNFRRAAEETFSSQSAISAHVKRLEELLGARLLERDRRRVLLTPDGERAVEGARRILDALDGLVAAVGRDEDPLAGTLRLGSIPTVAPFLIPRLMPAVRRTHPDARLLVREDQTARLVAMTQSGELDVIVLDVDVELGNLKSEVLFEDAFVLAVPEGHPLADAREVTLEQVDDLDLLLLEEGHCLSDRVRAFCRRTDDELESGDFRATSLVTLVHMVAAGLGATLLPELARHEFEHLPGLRLVPFAAPAPARRIGIAWRPTDARSRAFRLLGELVESCC